MTSALEQKGMMQRSVVVFTADNVSTKPITLCACGGQTRAIGCCRTNLLSCRVAPPRRAMVSDHGTIRSKAASTLSVRGWTALAACTRHIPHERAMWHQQLLMPQLLMPQLGRRLHRLRWRSQKIEESMEL
eukprot:SAG25_NODE_153_length_13583_cov_199.837659_9_plen_131_part_00